jgi:DNA-directed RNA polymerase delta subunit
MKERKNSFYQLAQKVLSEQKKPMHYMELTKEIHTRENDNYCYPKR